MFIVTLTLHNTNITYSASSAEILSLRIGIGLIILVDIMEFSHLQNLHI